MSNCSNHKKELFGEEDMKVVAEAIGDLHYETLAELLDNLQIKLWHDANKDGYEGRTMLSRSLLEACKAIRLATLCMTEAWQISKPFMDNELPNTQLTNQ